jgi:hypothetical protein
MLHVSVGGFPQLHTKSDVDTLLHLEVSGNAVKCDTHKAHLYETALPYHLV